MTERALNEATTRELLSLFGHVMDELRAREVVRTANNPVADYAEALVARALKLTLLGRSNAGCDAHSADGVRYEIKARRMTREKASTQISPLRALDQCRFDFLVGVLFETDFTVSRACLVPHAVVLRVARKREHVNGWIMHLRPALWNEPEVRDVTQEIRDAQLSL